MLIPQSLSELLLFSTVRLETTLTNGDSATGTAFFFDFQLGQNQTMPVLITNKHVIKNASVGNFFLHEAKVVGDRRTPSGKTVEVTVDAFEQRWFPHPDQSVDLCAMPILPLITQASAQGKEVFRVVLKNSDVPSQANLEGLRAVENILMVGYPTGLWDTVNNLPLVRRGITATHPAIDFNGGPISVIDMACFPGSSGSPVVILDEGSYTNKAGTLMAGSNRFFFLGVLYGGPVLTEQGEIIVQEIPTAQVSIAQTQLMIHLGYIVKAREVLALGEELHKHVKGHGDLPPAAIS